MSVNRFYSSVQGFSIGVAGVLIFCLFLFLPEKALGQANDAVQDTFTVAYPVGWSLLSIPYTIDGVVNASSVFSQADSVMVFENGSYRLTEEVTSGKGYLVYHPEAGSYVFEGIPLKQLNVGLNQGWNLIGSLGGEVAVSDVLARTSITAVYEVLDNLDVFQIADTLRAGRAYWVFVTDNFEALSLSVTDEDLVLNDTTVVLNNQEVALVSDSTQIQAGIYILEYQNAPPEIEINSIIVGADRGGYIRRVVSINANTNNRLELVTEPASLADAIENGSIQFSIPLDLDDQGGNKQQANKSGKYNKITWGPSTITYMAPGIRPSPSGFDFDSIELLTSANLKLLAEGSVDLITALDVFIEVGFFSIDYFRTEATGTLSTSLLLSLEADAMATLNARKKVFSFDKPFVFIVALGPVPFPVIGVVTTDVYLNGAATVDAEVNAGYSFNASGSLRMGAVYEDEVWMRIFEPGTSLSSEITYSASGHVDVRVGVETEIGLKLYGVLGPQLNLEPYLDYTHNVEFFTGDRDTQLVGGVDGKLKFEVAVLDKKLASFETPASINPRTLWFSPAELGIVSGDMQDGAPGETLPLPLVVYTKDSIGRLVDDIPVHFEVVEGEGSVDPVDPVTSEQGEAETVWTLGALNGTHRVNAQIRRADGSVINEVEFETEVSRGSLFISGLSSTLVSPNDAVNCTFQDGTVGSLFESTFSYQDLLGTVNAQSFVNYSFEFDVSGSSASFSFPAPLITGDAFQGMVTFNLCHIYGINNSLEQRVSFTSVAGNQSNTLTETIPRPSGVNKTTPYQGDGDVMVSINVP